MADRKLVVDAGAAIRMKQLDKLGKELYTTPGVFNEVKERQARQMLFLTPTDIKTTQPTTEDIKFVRAFAKETGDLAFLSTNDIELIALTYKLQRETGDVSKLRSSPKLVSLDKAQSFFAWTPQRKENVNPNIPSSPSQMPDKSTEEPDSHESEGEWVAKGRRRSVRSGDKNDAAGTANSIPGDDTPLIAEGEEEEKEEVDETIRCEDLTHDNLRRHESGVLVENSEPTSPGEAGEPTSPGAAGEAAGEDGVDGVDSDSRHHSKTPNQDFEICSIKDAEMSSDAGSDDSSSLDGSDAGEWVTADNLHRFNATVEEDEQIQVACVTTDYSIQNVLLQIGLNIVSIDGYKIRNVKLWGLLCRTCKYSMRDTSKVFCKKCGHSTVDRVPITVDATTGQMTVHDTRKRFDLKGTIYSIPTRVGGRQRPGQPKDIILCEDELMMGGRDRELRRQAKLAEKEKLLRDPLAVGTGGDRWCYRHTTKGGDRINHFESKVVVGYGRANPNANNFHNRTGNKKKKK